MGTVFAEQEYSGGSWQAPKAYVNVQKLYTGTRYTDSLYSIETYWNDDYNVIRCEPRSASPTYASQVAASGGTSTNGELNYSTISSTLGSEFAKPDDSGSATFNDEVNSIFENSVTLLLLSDTINQERQIDDIIVLACCQLYPVS